MINNDKTSLKSQLLKYITFINYIVPEIPDNEDTPGKYSFFSLTIQQIEHYNYNTKIVKSTKQLKILLYTPRTRFILVLQQLIGITVICSDTLVFFLK